MNASSEDSPADPQETIAQLRRALDEAQAREAAIAEVLQVINSSPGNLAPVFEAILEKAMHLCGAAFGILAVLEGGQARTAAARGLPDALAAWRQDNPIIGQQRTLLARTLAGEPFIHTLDLKDDELYSRGEPLRRANVDLGGARTSLYVPLRNDRDVLGTIHIYRQEVRAFSDTQIALLQNFAAQAVIAMENARLLTETREALAQQTATAEVFGVINASPGDLRPVFDAMVERAGELCEADEAAVRIFDGALLHLAAVQGPPGIFDELMRLGPSHPDGLYEGIAGGDAVTHFVDVRDTEAFHGNARARERLELRGIRSWLAVALRKDGVLLGVLNVHRRIVRPFTDKQIALLQNFAAQAVIAMENARLLTETREALAQQTATAEVLGVINASPGDLAPVFEAILEKAHDLCDAPQGSLFLREGEIFRAVTTRGMPEPFAARLREGIGSDGPVPQPLVAGKAFVHIPDMGEIDHPVARAAVDVGAARAVLGVPLRKGDELIGMIVAGRRELRPFADKEIALLQGFAAQAVIAMENARLITETREALERQTATAEVLGVINGSPGDLAPVFAAILEKAHELCGATFGGLLVCDGDQLRCAAFHNVPAEFQETAREPFRTGPGNPLHRLVEGEALVHIADIREAAANAPEGSIVRSAADLAGMRTLLCVPLRSHRILLGIITAYRREVRLFSDKEIALLQNFAAQAVIAMENARLIAETREALEQQTATAEVLGVINGSPGDLAPVFDAMLDRATRLCEADFGFFLSRQDGKFAFARGRGLCPEFAAYLLRMDQPGPMEANTAIAHGAGYMHIDDMKDDNAYSSGAAFRKALVDVGGGRTGLCIPMRKDGALLGTFNLVRHDVQPFSGKQISLVENFAAQAVIAMENARLITETREALEQQTATAEVLGVINSSPGDLAPVFDAILEKVLRLCGAAFGNLLSYDGELFHVEAAVHRDGHVANEQRQRPPFRAAPGGTLAPMLEGQSVSFFENIIETPDYKAGHAEFRRMVDSGGYRCVRNVALHKEGVFFGTIGIFDTEIRPFPDKQVALLQNFAAQAVVAMENARLLGELRQRTEEVAELNRGLEARVAEQVEELGRVGRLKRFLAPQLAEMIVSQGDEKILESHRREIVVVFCDLRGYTAFTETAEPEEVLDFLREYHGALGPLVAQFEGTLDQFSGDGIMVFFNDPVPIPDPAGRAANMAMAMREEAAALIAEWRERGRELGFGIGIAQGYATLGQIGFSERSGYTAIGTVCNVAARLCAAAKDGQILMSQRVNAALKGSIATEHAGALALKGLSQPIVAFNVPLAATQPALRLIEGGGPETV